MIVSGRQDNGFWFSVTAECRIHGVRYRPGVCYRLPGGMHNTVEKMQVEGGARIYNEEVRFVSGVAYPVAKKQPEAQAAPAARPAPKVGRKGRVFT